MSEREFIAESDDRDIRIDKYLALKLGDECSRTCVRSLIDAGMVTVNGEKTRASYLTKENDKVRVDLVPKEESAMKGEDIPVNIIFEDTHLIVVDKPAGMVVHPGAGNKIGTLANALLFHCKNLPKEAGDDLRPGIVHRLDKDTSGVIVIAKNDRTMRSVAKQFQKRAVKKTYVALVKGRVEFDNGVIDAPIARHAAHRKNMTVDYENGRTARTVYHVIKRFKNTTLLKLEPETGRTHQIRVHLKHIGHPVVGDRTYGAPDGAPRQLLHAATLGFSHPDTGKYVEFHSPIPSDMQAIIDGLQS